MLKVKGQEGKVFDYLTEAGQLLQSPMPLPLLPKPVDNNGKNFESMYMTDFIMYHISKGIKIHALYNDEPWIEIDTCEDLESRISLTRIKAIKMQIEAENARKRS